MRCLSKDPDVRPPSAGELAVRLRGVRGLEPRAAGAGAELVAVTPTLPSARGPDTIPAEPTRPSGGSPTSVLPHIAVESSGAKHRSPRRLRWLVYALVGVFLVAAVAGSLAWALSPGGSAAASKPPPKPHPLVLHPPSGVSANGACDGFLRFRVAVSWVPTGSPLADGYAIYRDDGKGGALRLVGRVPGRFAGGFVDHDLGSSTTYRFAVRSTYGTKVGPASPSVIGVTPLLCMA
jgi:hypothetical protein